MPGGALNERLDYFGQTVNLAARVQRLAADNEIYLSDEIYSLLAPVTCWRPCSPTRRPSTSKASRRRSRFTPCAPGTKASRSRVSTQLYASGLNPFL